MGAVAPVITPSPAEGRFHLGSRAAARGPTRGRSQEGGGAVRQADRPGVSSSVMKDRACDAVEGDGPGKAAPGSLAAMCPTPSRTGAVRRRSLPARNRRRAPRPPSRLRGRALGYRRSGPGGALCWVRVASAHVVRRAERGDEELDVDHVARLAVDGVRLLPRVVVEAPRALDPHAAATSPSSLELDVRHDEQRDALELPTLHLPDRFEAMTALKPFGLAQPSRRIYRAFARRGGGGCQAATGPTWTSTPRAN